MLHYFLKRFGFSAWNIILLGSIIILFILWIFFSNRETSSSSTTFNDAVHKMFEPVSTPPSSPVSTSPSFPNETPSKISSKGETKCREILERITGEKFDNVRPSWLVNPVTGQSLELDCYNEKLKLAVEYNGIQHYKFNKYMHQNSRDKFQNQQYRDLIKKDLCQKNNVHLIVVPYDIDIKNIESFLLKKVKEYIENKV